MLGTWPAEVGEAGLRACGAVDDDCAWCGAPLWNLMPATSPSRPPRLRGSPAVQRLGLPRPSSSSSRSTRSPGTEDPRPGRTEMRGVILSPGIGPSPPGSKGVP